MQNLVVLLEQDVATLDQQQHMDPQSVKITSERGTSMLEPEASKGRPLLSLQSILILELELFLAIIAGSTVGRSAQINYNEKETNHFL